MARTSLDARRSTGHKVLEALTPIDDGVGVVSAGL